MTLEEAIKNFEQEIGEFEGLKKIHAVTYEDYEYIEKTRQLVEWLKELKAVHDEIDDADDEDEIFIGYLRKKMRGRIMHWIDNADSYICPVCGFETNNPNKYEECKCPVCGFQDEKDRKASDETDKDAI